ncbi:MAG: immunity 22 family protein, partial [Gammaproteobacteria bacterium]
QDLCGVGYYDLSNQESNYGDNDMVDPARLLAPLSYSQTFIDSVIAAAKEKGIEKARGVVVQYDFAYDPAVVKREIAAEPVFIGVFPYSVK